ncbi:uncharacterized protein LOC131929636 [Physella acuta]|uniref:uncharacterized protein LOC131929636 n=1 Tax=Physella acuta TaxID=109671 RepID=UPI0027DC06F7|nr:uncharacterized protein LOC131929636 [Physella acuta]
MRTSITLATCLAFWTWTSCHAFNCKFPNDSCEDNSECCSGKCNEAHSGTNPRCTKLGLHKPCLYSYQCQSLLLCGSKNRCCSKFWGFCNHDRDCCESKHKCLPARGFYYNRCLVTNIIPIKNDAHTIFNSPYWRVIASSFVSLFLYKPS